MSEGLQRKVLARCLPHGRLVSWGRKGYAVIFARNISHDDEELAELIWREGKLNLLTGWRELPASEAPFELSPPDFAREEVELFKAIGFRVKVYVERIFSDGRRMRIEWKYVLGGKDEVLKFIDKVSEWLELPGIEKLKKLIKSASQKPRRRNFRLCK